MAAKESSADKITEQLRGWTGGKDSKSGDSVLDLVYNELHYSGLTIEDKQRS